MKGSTKTTFYRAAYCELENIFIIGFGALVGLLVLNLPHVVWAGGVVTQVVQPATSKGSTFQSGDADGFIIDSPNVLYNEYVFRF